jgi:arylsulfatase A-like enzyme
LVVYPGLPPRPNVILITIDALRSDHLGCYGYKRDTSPNIDELAKDGVIFTQAISQASVTAVSLASLLTSVYPARTGIISQVRDIMNDFTCPTIIEEFNRNKYRTAVFFPDDIAIGLPAWAYRGAEHQVIHPQIHGKADDALLTRQLIDWVVQDSKRGFFTWIHYRGVHTPYLPPAPYNRLFVNDQFYNQGKKIPLLKDNTQVWGGIRPQANLNNIREVDYYVAQYDGALKYVDFCIGELLRMLKDRGFYENTVVIIGADHGEALGEHNLYFGHANTLYDELLRVPLIIKFPGKAFRGRRFTGQVRLVDIMPTILQYLKLKIPRYTDGISLMPILEGRVGHGPVFSFSKTNIMNAVRSEEWKLISYDSSWGKDELYNLKIDPGELDNLALQETGIVKRFKEELVKFNYGFSCACPRTQAKEDETAQARKFLYSLGYMQ